MINFFIKKKSSIHGIGIFATKKITKNLLFYKVPLVCIFNNPKSRCAYIGKNLWVSDQKVLNFVNHSCDPNSILNIPDKPKLIAKKDINPGEEITVDYNRTEKSGAEVPCKCSSKNCKKYFKRIE